MMSTGKHSRNVSQRVGLDCQIQRHFAWLVLSDLSRRQENTSSLRRSFRSIDSKWRYHSSKMLGQNCTPKPQASCAVDLRVWIVLQTTCPDGHLRTVVMHGLIIPIRHDTAVILHVIISSSSSSSFHSFVTSYTEIAVNSQVWVGENSCSAVASKNTIQKNFKDRPGLLCYGSGAFNKGSSFDIAKWRA